MITEFQANQVFFADKLPQKYPRWTQKFFAFLQSEGIQPQLISGTRDIWARDYMPVQVGENQWVSFHYRPDYLERHEELRTDRDHIDWQPLQVNLTISDLKLDGGNVVSHQEKVILTSKVLKENQTNHRVLQDLEDYFQAQVILIPKEPYDYVGHSDGVMRFIDDNRVLVNDYSFLYPNYQKSLDKVYKKYNLNPTFLPYNPRYQEIKGGIPSARGCYINFMPILKSLIVPIFGLETDEPALSVLRKSYPNHRILPYNFNIIAQQGGCANCISWTVYKHNTP